MAEFKTQRTDASVDAFIDGLDGEAKKGDARELVRLMQGVARAARRCGGAPSWGLGSGG